MIDQYTGKRLDSGAMRSSYPDVATPVTAQAFLQALERLEYCIVCCYAIDPSYRARHWEERAPHPAMVFFKRMYGHEASWIRDTWWPRRDFGVRVIALQLAACVAADNALEEV